MSELLLPAAFLVLSVAVTYWLCLRPMRRGRCGFAPRHGHACRAHEATTDADTEVGRLRREIRVLRAQVAEQRPATEARPERPAAQENATQRS
ncbi:hypothetical protein [Cellulomonas sp. ATA003]|uniref:hypothetical protein n=1 Tax=Cellulomonas sp. ATA003 TaxID=3073064 RepID=UPI002873D5A1|nr:hypothetical protein [Cellulomonas sp. ATA003]WNB84760.1 hypothetical protein REH70_13405 [Cellulomonas sp. ATA003]